MQVRVGPSGAVYLSGMYHPVGAAVPDGIDPQGAYPAGLWGTLIKFDGAPGRFPVGRMFGLWDDLGEREPTHVAGAGWRLGQGTPFRVENMLWDYGGVAPIVQVGCTCFGGSFDLDGFERAFVPAVQTSSVNVLDAGGNLVLRIGGYGNVDSREPAFVGPRYAAATDEALYVDDYENERVVRMALGYHVEETLELPAP